MRHILKERGVGPDALPPMPSERPRDWLDDLLDSNAPTPAPAKEAAEPKPEPAKPKKPQPGNARKARKRNRQQAKRHNPDMPRSAWDNEPRSPRQSLLDAWDNVPPRLKWLLFHAAAAGIGWRLGWVRWSTNTAAWFAAGHAMTFSAFVLYGLGVGALALYRYFQTRMWPVALAAAVPVSSVVLGLLLYGSGYENLRIPL